MVKLSELTKEEYFDNRIQFFIDLKIEGLLPYHIDWLRGTLESTWIRGENNVTTLHKWKDSDFKE